MSKKRSEILLVLGYPCSGKSTMIARQWSDYYHVVANQHTESSFAATMEKALTTSSRNSKRIVVECSSATRESRSEAIAKAKQYGVPITCKWIDASYVDSMFNVCWRFMEEFNRIIDTDDVRGEYANHHTALTIGALNSYRRAFEEPVYQEGFAHIEKIPFKRANQFGKKKAVIFDYNGTLRESSGLFDFPVTPDEVRIMPNRTDKIINMQRKGYMLLGTSNEAGIYKKLIAKSKAVECFDRTNEMLGADINWTMCRHREDPVSCFCRKPNVGMGVYFIKRFMLNPSECIVVGSADSEKEFAQNCGFQYQDQKEFF